MFKHFGNTFSTFNIIYFLVGVVGNISACHADARGSIPRLGVFFSKKIGKKIRQKKRATNGIRTHDLSLTKRVLYQLSYSGNITPSVGIEPTAIGLKGQRSTI